MKIRVSVALSEGSEESGVVVFNLLFQWQFHLPFDSELFLRYINCLWPWLVFCQLLFSGQCVYVI